MPYDVDERVVIPRALDMGNVAEVISSSIYKVRRDANKSESNYEEFELSKVPMEKIRVHFKSHYCIVCTIENNGVHQLDVQAYRKSGGRIRR